MRKVAPVPPSPALTRGDAVRRFGAADRRMPMLDLVLIAVVVGGFVLLAGYGALCDRL